jgi:hypothetical protein
MRRIMLSVAALLGVLLVAIQLVPYGRAHVNPPVTAEPRWDSPRTRALAARACFDCHSNETAWPWYSHVAPVSWLIQRDVDEGRRKLNYSEWDRGQREAHESAKTVRKGEMPPWFYALPATRSRLTPDERTLLLAGLEATFGAERARDGRSRTKDKDDD